MEYFAGIPKMHNEAIMMNKIKTYPCQMKYLARRAGKVKFILIRDFQFFLETLGRKLPAQQLIVKTDCFRCSRFVKF